MRAIRFEQLELANIIYPPEIQIDSLNEYRGINYDYFIADHYLE